MSYTTIVHKLKTAGNPKKAVFLKRFFKTEKGQYGHGDVFIGISVPVQRAIARMYPDLDERSLTMMLADVTHEYRLTALIILTHQFTRGDEKTKKHIYEYYLSKIQRVNNWDLVDLSAPHIVGAYLMNKPKKRNILYRLARSQSLWKRRIAIVSTFSFIRKNQFEDTLKLATLLLTDTHDLIHKAVGWMLREVGKRDRTVLRKFLDLHAHTMPRTMLRYALEHFDPQERLRYMKSMKSRAGT